jgi:DNA-binding XRE family transcriptional regulator
MGYQLWMHSAIRGWLSKLRDSEPEVARLVGEAVLALLEAGDSLGAPLVVALESVLRAPDDPREALDDSYQRQLEALQEVRRGVADVATSRKRVELQTGELEQGITRLARQRQAALDAGHEDLAAEAQARAAEIQEQLARQRQQLSVLVADEERLSLASRRMAAKVDAFRVQKETLKATYTARQAARLIGEAVVGLGENADDLAGPEAPAEDPAGPADEAHLPLPPGLLELRPGAPGHGRAGLLFVLRPSDTAVLLAWVGEEFRSVGDYRELLPLVTARLALAQSGAPAAAPAGLAAQPSEFVAYDTGSFLDQFFPGAETEVEIAAAALVARHRAHTLAQARQRIGLTQEQVAQRMNVRQERVSAIERAEPGATEVRTLAAYVSALGGRLEIIADLGAERITLK